MSFKDRLRDLLLNKFGSITASGEGKNEPVPFVKSDSEFYWRTKDKQPFPYEWDEYVNKSSKKYNLEPRILASVLANESGSDWNPLAEGDNGKAFGLGQIHTADFFGSSDYKDEKSYKEALKNPEYAIDETGRILRYKTDSFGNGDTFWGIVRYNGGGQQAIDYAKSVLKRIGRQDLIPEEYK